MILIDQSVTRVKLGDASFMLSFAHQFRPSRSLGKHRLKSELSLNGKAKIAVGAPITRNAQKSYDFCLFCRGLTRKYTTHLLVSREQNGCPFICWKHFLQI